MIHSNRPTASLIHVQPSGAPQKCHCRLDPSGLRHNLTCVPFAELATTKPFSPPVTVATDQGLSITSMVEARDKKTHLHLSEHNDSSRIPVNVCIPMSSGLAAHSRLVIVLSCACSMVSDRLPVCGSRKSMRLLQAAARMLLELQVNTV